MVHSLQLRVDPRTAATPLMVKAQASTMLNVDANAICDVVVRKRSIDARQRRVMVNLTVDVYVGEAAPAAPFGTVLPRNTA